jgi:amino acid adenylation domain-containing protein
MIELLKKAFNENETRFAFCINDQYYTYHELSSMIFNICEAIINAGGSNSKVAGIVTTDTLQTYASIFSCWYLGLAYVPLNPKIPIERNQFIIESAGADIILTSENNIAEICRNSEEVQYVNTNALKTVHSDPTSPIDANEDMLMYILFTSGSTGIPKGVPINYKNLTAFIDSYNALGYKHSWEDRFLQMFDLTFDVSIASYLIPLLNGACVYTVPPVGIKYMSCYKIMRDHKITVAILAPSIIIYLKPYFTQIVLPELKYCIFTAEAPNSKTIHQWSSCIPNSKVINLYGPTEATIWATGYLIDLDAIKSYNEMIAIGKPFKHITAIIVDDKNNDVAQNIKGELCISGAQISMGYLNNEEKNRSSFFIKNSNRFYRTGDLCYRDEDGDIFYCGRIDHQVKIQGFRIELSEIEFTVRTLFNLNNVAVGHKNKMGLEQITLFVENYKGQTEAIIRGLERKLPYYMIPAQIRIMDELPYNNSGKVDRAKLESKVK